MVYCKNCKNYFPFYIIGTGTILKGYCLKQTEMNVESGEEYYVLCKEKNKDTNCADFDEK